MRNSSSLDWLRFMHTPNDYPVSRFKIGGNKKTVPPFPLHNTPQKLGTH